MPTRYANIEAKDGAILASVPLYAGLHEVPLRQYVPFLREAEKLQGDDESDAARPNYVLAMAKAVSEFYGIDLEATLSARIGDLEALQGDALEAVDGTLSTLFGWAVKTVNAFTPALVNTEEAARFDYRGKTFFIPVWNARGALGVELPPDLETIEAVEAEECKRLARKSEQEKGGDPTGTIEYVRLRSLVAILARKEGERLPFSDTEREAFLVERQAFFTDIDAATALNVDFFLRATAQRYGGMLETVGSLTRPTLLLAVATQLRKPAPLPKRKSTTKQSLTASAGTN